MIRVLHVITGLGAGGAETMLTKLLARMDRTRFESLVVSLTDRGALGQTIEEGGTPVETLGLKRGMPDPRGFLRLRKRVQTWKPDVIQSWMYHADVLTTLACAGLSVPLLWNIRCSQMDVSDFSRLSRLTLRTATRLSRRPAGIVVNSIAGRDYHQRIGYAPRAWHFIPNGFDLERFRPDAEARREIRASLGISDGTPLVGCLGRFDPIKDYPMFFAAAAMVAPESGVHFVIAGDGMSEENEPVRQLVAAHPELAGRVHLLGYRRDVARILAALDVFVLSSMSEGFPNVIGEAMACGALCVTTDAGDAATIVGDCGIVVPPRDANALASGMRKALALSPDARADWSRRGRCRIAEEFSIGAIAAQYEALYASLAGRAS